MVARTSRTSVKSSRARPSANDAKADGARDRRALIDAIECERLRILRARAIAQTAAELLRERFILERAEPDIGCVIDVVCEMLEHSIAGLDRITLHSL